MVFLSEELTREQKEKFIRESWKEFNDPNDGISIPALKKFTEREIDAMVKWYDYLWEK